MTQTTRVLCIVTEAYGGRGGIARTCRDLLGALAKQDDIARIDVLPRLAPDAVGLLQEKIHQGAPLAGKFQYAFNVLAKAIASKPTLVFCNHLFMAPLAGAAARVAGARLIIQLHGIEIWKPPTALQRRALEGADLLCCVSRDTRMRVLQAADIAPERAVVVNNCVGAEFRPDESARARMRERLGAADACLLLSVGRLDARERYKGHDRVIAAIAREVLARKDRLLYVIAGDGDDRERLTQLARQHGVEECVRFLGAVNETDLVDLYRAADLFALPSEGEGFGIVFLEAMACGAPAIGLAAGGAPDALGDGALGQCVAVEDFAKRLSLSIQARPDPEALSKAVHDRFGQAVFERNIANMLSVMA